MRTKGTASSRFLSLCYHNLTSEADTLVRELDQPIQ